MNSNPYAQMAASQNKKKNPALPAAYSGAADPIAQAMMPNAATMYNAPAQPQAPNPATMYNPQAQQPASPYGATGAMTQPAAQPASPYGATGAMTQPPTATSPYGAITAPPPPPPPPPQQSTSPYRATGAMTQPSAQPASPYDASGAMARPVAQQPASPYTATGAMTQPAAAQPASPYGATGAMTQPAAAQPASPYGATGAMTQTPAAQPASPYDASGAMAQPAVQQPASPYTATGAMVQPEAAQPASPYDATGAMAQPAAPQPASPYGETGAMVQPAAPQPASPYTDTGAMSNLAVLPPSDATRSPYSETGAMIGSVELPRPALSPYDASGAMVQPATPELASPYSPSGRQYAATKLRTASQQSPYDPLTGALTAEQGLPEGYAEKVAAKDAARIDQGLADYQAMTAGVRPEAPPLPEISSLADYQAMPAGGADPTMTGQSYADLTSGRTTSPSMAADAYAAMTAGGGSETMAPQSYADLTSGRPMSPSMTPDDYAAMTASGADPTMTPQSYADLTAGRGSAATMTADDYAALTAGPGEAAAATTPAVATTPTMGAEDYAALTAGPGAVETPAGADSLQAALQQAYMGRIGGDDPILASQLADQQERQRQQEQATIEQLSRYGVLRGGGDTANVLMQMREGQERNRLALEASAAQRQQQDLRDALGFEQAQSQMGLAGRGMGLQERLGAQDIEGSRLQRELQRAGVTGQFRGGDTMAERELTDRLATTEAQRGAIGGAERRADIAQEAGLFGEVAGAGSAPARQTMGGLGAAEARAASRAQRTALGGAERRADIAQEAGLFGEIAGAGSAPARQTMGGRQTDEALLASEAQRTALGGAERRADVAQEAGLFGEVSGAGSAPARRTEAGLEGALRRDLARSADVRQQQQLESGLFGQVATGVSPLEGPVQTLSGQQATEAIAGQRLAREATEAGLTGQFRGGRTAAERAQASALESQDLQRRLAEAGVTGDYYNAGPRGPTETLQAQALESEMQGQALQRALQRAGATGEFLEEGADAEAAVPTLERRLREAALTGRLGEDPTLAGRQADMDLVGAILAGADVSDKAGMPQLMSALTQNIQNFDPTTIQTIQDALNTSVGFQNQENPDGEDTGGGASFTVVDGEVVGGEGGGQDATNPRTQAWSNFVNEENLGSGQYRPSPDGLSVYNSMGQLVARYNSTTGRYERT